MNEETNTPETLADIIAEMRRFAAFAAGRSRITPAPSLAAEQECHAAKLTKYADRIEAAAKRERAITDIMLAVKDKPLPHPDPEHAPPLFFPMTKTQLQTLSDLVAIAHDEMDGLPHHEQELERFDSLLSDMKARYAFDKPYTDPPEHPSNAAAMRAALERCNELFRCDDDNKLRLCHLARKADEATQAALAAPARNCDRFQTEEEAYAAFMGRFDHFKGERNYQYCKWLFAPAEGGDHA